MPRPPSIHPASGLQFPEPDGPLTGFATRIVADCGLDGDTVAHAERVLGARIIAVDGAIDFAPDAVLAGGAELVVYGEVVTLRGTAPLRSVARGRPKIGGRLWSVLRRRRDHPPRLNPILTRLAVATLAVFLVGSWYFHAIFGGAWLDAV